MHSETQTIYHWYNYATDSWDHRADWPTTELECQQYIRQEPSHLSLFQVYLDIGKTPYQAMANVLAASCNQPPPFPLSTEPASEEV